MHECNKLMKLMQVAQKKRRGRDMILADRRGSCVHVTLRSHSYRQWRSLSTGLDCGTRLTRRACI